MRVAVLDRDSCQPRRCVKECQKFCPKVRSGDETIIFGEDKKPIISEVLCIGCGICVKKCPFDAIKIINLPEKLKSQETHRYGKNGFILFGLPIPRVGEVTGILGPNGIGKTTAIKILTGELKPNLGAQKSFGFLADQKAKPFEGGEEMGWKEILRYLSGSELQKYFKRVIDGKIRSSYKLQDIDSLQKFKGTVSDFLEETDERGEIKKLTERLGLEEVSERNISDLSGGELQRVAIASCLSREREFYFFDEITPYLDIYQRVRVAKIIKELSKEKSVMVVEHDLAILDLLTDAVHVVYGEPGVYGVITHPLATRTAINQYIRGDLQKENIRIRDKSIKFEVHAPRSNVNLAVLKEFGRIYKSYGKFSLEVNPGDMRKGEIIGGIGPNSIGKSTFAKILSGVIEPTAGNVDFDLKISYKPQYVRGDLGLTVAEILAPFMNPHYETEFINPLRLKSMMRKKICDLSGGELQRIAIVLCLSRDADLYILDEPSAHLDVEERTMISRIIRRFIENKEATAVVIDHDVYLIDLVSDRLIVFSGEPGTFGRTNGPLDMREGMNLFLKELNITFRRDEDTKRPRINKLNSRLDREQKEKGEYYYR